MRLQMLRRWRVLVAATILALGLTALGLVVATDAFAGEDPCCKFTANCEGGYWGHTCYLKSLGCNTGFDDNLCSEIPDP